MTVPNRFLAMQPKMIMKMRGGKTMPLIMGINLYPGNFHSFGKVKPPSRPMQIPPAAAKKATKARAPTYSPMLYTMVVDFESPPILIYEGVWIKISKN